MDRDLGPRYRRDSFGVPDLEDETEDSVAVGVKRHEGCDAREGARTANEDQHPEGRNPRVEPG